MTETSNKTRPALFSSKNRKRSAEPRPHPSHTLNKRYWDDVRAGRISLSTQNNGSQQKVPKRPLSMPKTPEDVVPKRHFPSFTPSKYGSIRPPQPPLLGQMELVVGQDKLATSLLDREAVTKMEQLMASLMQQQRSGGAGNVVEEATNRFLRLVTTNEGFASTAQELPSSFTAHLQPVISTNSVWPISCSSAQSASDHQVDLIADSMLLRKSSNASFKIQFQPNSMPSTYPSCMAGRSAVTNRHGEVCLVPIPVPILLPLPLTVDFIHKHYSQTSATTILKMQK